MWRPLIFEVSNRKAYASSLSSWLRRVLLVPAIGAVSLVAADKEISWNRVLLGLVCLSYVLILCVTHRLLDLSLLIYMAVYFAVSLMLVFTQPNSQRLLCARRYFALIFDIASISFSFAVAGVFAAPAFLLYLWLVVGYGFRYGIVFLRLAAGLSLFGFGIAACMSPHWSEQLYMIVSFAATLFIIPIYIELLLRKLLRANEHIKDANHAKALMLAGLGHELRAPLGSIESSAERLLRTKLDLVQMDMVNSLQVATKSLKLELDDFLDVSKIEAGRTTVQLDRFSTAQAVRDALHMVAAEAQAKSLRMSWHISSTVPVELNLDRAHFIKVLTNFLNNAVKFTNTGSVTVYLGLAVEMGKNAGIRGEVTDTGIGIERDAREKIWESFAQANRKIVQSYGGAGLGLSVARQLVELMGGTTGVESKLGKGSTFWFQMPMPVHSGVLPISEWPVGLAVVLVGPKSDGASSVLRHARDHGGQIFHAEQIRGVLPAVASASDDIDRFVIMVDGRESDPIQVAYALRFDAALGRVPMILIHDSNKGVSPAERQMYVTAIPAMAERNALISALRIADNFEDTNTMDKLQPPSESDLQTLKNPRLKILIAERSASNRLLLTKQLEAAGHACWAVEDGEQVIASFAEESYDLVMMDTDVSKINGFDTTQMLRFISAEAHSMPVIGIADDITPGLKQRSIDAGMRTLLSRPVTTAQIMTSLADCLPISHSHVGPVIRQETVVKAISTHPKYRAEKGPPLHSASLSHLGLRTDQNLLNEVRLALQADATGALASLRQAINDRNIEEYHSQLQIIRSAAVTLGASHLEQLCNEGGKYVASSLSMQGRVLLHKIESEFGRVDGMLNGSE